jgi:deoxyhypusine synthase
MSEKPADNEAQSALDAVLLKSVEMPAGTPTVQGYDFEGDLDLQKLLDSMLTSGFQATQLGRAVDEVNRMLRWRLSDEPVGEDDSEEEKDPKYRASVRTKIFLGFTSNLISSGVREQLVFMMKHRMIDVLVTTAGGVEEDFIKCLAPTYLGDWSLKGKELRSQGLNRIGNLLVPNDNYCKFEDWMMPILDAMKKEQDEDGVRWTPSRVIKRLGFEIDDPSVGVLLGGEARHSGVLPRVDGRLHRGHAVLPQLQQPRLGGRFSGRHPRDERRGAAGHAAAQDGHACFRRRRR